MKRLLPLTMLCLGLFSARAEDLSDVLHWALAAQANQIVVATVLEPPFITQGSAQI